MTTNEESCENSNFEVPTIFNFTSKTTLNVENRRNFIYYIYQTCNKHNIGTL